MIHLHEGCFSIKRWALYCSGISPSKGYGGGEPVRSLSDGRAATSAYSVQAAALGSLPAGIPGSVDAGSGLLWTAIVVFVAKSQEQLIVPGAVLLNANKWGSSVAMRA